MKPPSNDQITAKLETITPTLAASYFEKNYVSNRKLRPIQIANIADQIKRGQWIVNGASICFTISGALTDGQHRLAAIAQSGKTVQSVVVRNLPDKAFLTIDTGIKRSNADILHIAGEMSSIVLACSARYLIAWEKQKNFGYKSREKTSAADVQTILRKHPGLRDAIKEMSGRNIVIKRIGPSFISTFFYLISTVDHTEAVSFYDQVFFGTDLSKGHPILALRNLLLARAQEPGMGTRFDPFLTGRQFVKTWSLFCKGERIEKMNIKPDDEGLDYLETPKGTFQARYNIGFKPEQ